MLLQDLKLPFDLRYKIGSNLALTVGLFGRVADILDSEQQSDTEEIHAFKVSYGGKFLDNFSISNDEVTHDDLYLAARKLKAIRFLHSSGFYDTGAIINKSHELAVQSANDNEYETDEEGNSYLAEVIRRLSVLSGERDETTPLLTVEKI